MVIPHSLSGNSADLRRAIASDDAGAVIRLARRAAGLNQTQLGRRCGYSTSTISRIERGQPPVNDIKVRRRIAEVLRIPPQHLGLAAATRHHQPAPATGVADPPHRAITAKVWQGATGDGGDSPMRRRDLLTGIAASATAGLWTSAGEAAESETATTGLESLLLASAVPAQTTLSPPQLTDSLNTAWHRYDNCSYHELTRTLPALISTTHTVRDAATGQQRELLSATLATTYRLAAALCVKLDDDAIAWVLADRALTAAQHSGNPTCIAACTRAVAIAMRRAGHHDGAVQLLTTTAVNLDTNHGQISADTIAAYGTLLCTAAYSSAQHDRRATAVELINEAATAASRLAAPVHGRGGSLSSTNVKIYKIGVFTALGDTPAALKSAQAVDPHQLPTAERYARYCVDTSRAWRHHGRPDRACQALLVAERCAPQEVRRPSVRALVSTLLYAPTPVPHGLKDLATRIGAIAP